MIEQRTEAWHEQRKGRVTGSIAGAILGDSRFMTPEEVMRKLVRSWFNADSEFTGNIATNWGNEHEDDAKQKYEEETGNLVVEEGFVVHPDHDWIGASPDGLVGQLGMVEFKCPFAKRNDENPIFDLISDRPEYYAQMQFEMACTGRIWCDFVQWNPYAINIQRVRYNPEWFAEHLPRFRAFYDKFQTTINDEKLAAPYLEELELYTEREDLMWGVATEGYRKAKIKYEAAKAELDRAKEQLVELAEGKKTKGFGVAVYKRVSQGSTNYKKMVAQLLPDADQSKFKGKPNTSWVVKEV